MYLETPNVPGTPESRIKALKEARVLLKEEPEVTNGIVFGGGSTKPGAVAPAAELIRVATYIETGHDYRDTHPEGKRRPLQRITNVTVMAPEGELEHLMSHLEDGSFAEFLDDMTGQGKPEAADPEKSDGRD